MSTGMSMELSNYLVSWVVTYLGDLQPSYIGLSICLLSSMDILVGFCFLGGIRRSHHPLEDILFS